MGQDKKSMKYRRLLKEADDGVLNLILDNANNLKITQKKRSLLIDLILDEFTKRNKRKIASL